MNLSYCSVNSDVSGLSPDRRKDKEARQSGGDSETQHARHTVVARSVGVAEGRPRSSRQQPLDRLDTRNAQEVETDEKERRRRMAGEDDANNRLRAGKKRCCSLKN